MNRGNRKVVLFIVSLISLALILLYLEVTIFTPKPYPHEGNIAGLVIQFRDGITEKDAKNILENYNFSIYEIDCPVYYMPDKYYIVVNEDKIMDVKKELRKENWTESTPAIEKGNYYINKKEDYYIITIAKQNIYDESFIEMLNKYNLEVEKFVYCYIRFGEHPLSGISGEHANELKDELEMNENIFTVYFESFE